MGKAFHLREDLDTRQYPGSVRLSDLTDAKVARYCVWEIRQSISAGRLHKHAYQTADRICCSLRLTREDCIRVQLHGTL